MLLFGTNLIAALGYKEREEAIAMAIKKGTQLLPIGVGDLTVAEAFRSRLLLKPIDRHLEDVFWCVTWYTPCSLKKYRVCN